MSPRPPPTSPEARLLVVDALRRTVTPRVPLRRVSAPPDLVIANDAATLPSILRADTRNWRTRRSATRQPPFAHPEEVSALVPFSFALEHFRTRPKTGPRLRHLRRDRLVLGRCVRLCSCWGIRVSCLTFLLRAGMRFGRTGATGTYTVCSPSARALGRVERSPVIGLVRAAVGGFALDCPFCRVACARSEFHHHTRQALVTATMCSTASAFDEPYAFPRTAIAIRPRGLAWARCAIGTSVVPRSNTFDADGLVRDGEGIATGRLCLTSRLRVVDAILSHAEPGTSHYDCCAPF